MDPITALSIGSSAVAFIDFAINLFAAAKKIHTSSSHQQETVAEIDSLSQSLSAWNAQLTSQLAAAQSATSSQCDQSLIRLCGECRDLVAEIEGVVGELTAGGTTKWDAVNSSVRVAIKGLKKREAVRGLNKRLEHMRAEIMIGLLVSFQYVNVCFDSFFKGLGLTGNQ